MNFLQHVERIDVPFSSSSLGNVSVVFHCEIECVLPLIGGRCEYLHSVGCGLIHILLAVFSLTIWDVVAAESFWPR